MLLYVNEHRRRGFPGSCILRNADALLTGGCELPYAHILTADSLVQNIASFLCLPPRAVALINWWTIFARYLARLVSIMTLDERLSRAARL